MFERLQKLFTRLHALREVDNLSDRDLHDMGVSRAQVEFFVQLPEDTPERMFAMASAFGLTPDEVREVWPVYLDTLRNCGECDSVTRCRETLARGGDIVGQAAAFCPNAGTYAKLSAAH